MIDVIIMDIIVLVRVYNFTIAKLIMVKILIGSFKIAVLILE